MNRISRTIGQLPVGLIATTLGLATLSNGYYAIGLTIIRTIVMSFGMIVWSLAAIKILACRKVFIAEYNQVVPSSLYATFPMLTAVLSSFLYGFNELTGTFFWYLAVIMHLFHIVVFTYRNVFKNFQKATFLPTWFVTYVGLLVPVVVGSHIGHPWLLQAILFYGFTVTLILVPLMLKKSVPSKMAVTNCIYFAPLSLCVVAYLNVRPEPHLAVIVFFASCLLVALTILSRKILSFVKRSFDPTFASLTFPVAIATIAFYRIGQYLLNADLLLAASIFATIFELLLFFATGLLLFVGYRFVSNYLTVVIGNMADTADFERAEVGN